ncbi:hypothetical protein V2E29_06895 [Streptomyces diastatochromogenes]
MRYRSFSSSNWPPLAVWAAAGALAAAAVVVARLLALRTYRWRR